MSEVLTPYAFISVAELATYLNKDSTATGESDRLVRALNGATSWMNRRAARNLKARNYRTAVSVVTTGTTATSSTTLNVPTATLKAGDELLGAGLTPGTVILTIDSASALTMSAAPTVQVAAGATITTGTKPIFWDMTSDLDYGTRRIEWPDPVLGSQELYLPEYPVLAGNIWAIYWLDANGAKTAVDLTTIRLEESMGRVIVSGDVFPRGDLKLQLEFRGGYEQPAATQAGHWTAWEDMRRISRRAAEVFYQDELALRGRSVDTTLGGFSARVPSMEMPADIEDALRPYWRMSG